MIAVFRRELNGYFKSVTGYLLAALLLIFAGIYCMAYNLSGYYANFEYVLEAISFIFLIAVPIISMRALAEEKHSKTDQLLYSLPFSMACVVIGKYLAMLVVLALPVGIMALYPLVLSQFGTISFATAYAALLAFFLMGGCLLSVGLFISSVTESQIASAVITLVAMLLLYFMNSLANFVSTESMSSLIALGILVILFSVLLYVMAKNALISVITALIGIGALILWYQADNAAFSGLFANMMSSISIFDRLETFVEGVFDLTAIVYWVSISCVFVFLSVQAMEKRRWSE